jgi:hypothetical protein
LHAGYEGAFAKYNGKYGKLLNVMVIGIDKGRSCLKKWKHVVILLAVTFGIFGSTTLPQHKESPEYHVKAVFLYNIVQFVEWPKDSVPNETSPIIIGILGIDPFGSFLDDTVLGEDVNGHPLIIERYASVHDIKNCHILFIHSEMVPKLPTILKKLKGKGILTVGDAVNFAKQGGMVRFFTQENKIKIRINLKAVKEENITISSKLLRLAEIVDPT